MHTTLNKKPPESGGEWSEIHLVVALLGQAPDITCVSISCLGEDCSNNRAEKHLSLLKYIFFKKSCFVSPEYLAESMVGEES